jgi:hypothetical protein
MRELVIGVCPAPGNLTQRYLGLASSDGLARAGAHQSLAKFNSDIGAAHSIA